MSKTFVLKNILGVEGKPLTRTVFDEDGRPVIEDGKVKSTKANLSDLIDLLIANFPRERMTMENITHGVELKRQRAECRNGTLVLKEGDHDWFRKMLKDDAVGPKIFGFNLPFIIDELDNFERTHEPGESKSKSKK